MSLYALISEDFVQPWRAEAACRGMDPEIFFPGQGAGQDEAEAICAECPVKEPCGEHAITKHEDHGVWGGLSENARRRERSRRMRVARRAM